MQAQNFIVHKSFLLVMLAIYGVLLWVFKGNQNIQVLITIVTVTFYIIWGVTYHKLKNRLSKSIIFEYILIALIIVLIVVYLSSI